MFNTIDEVYNWLYNQKKLSKRENLKRITFVAEDLDLIPTYKIVHIAGTNGKGSTASYLKNILKNTGKHIGFFVSPFVVCFNERIQINDRYISDAEIMYYANILYEYSNSYFEKYNDIIPFFELTFLMALMFFKDRNIDLAIIECGLGGRLDATNFLKTDLAIITNIGYDHMATLGNTLEEIAYHKLGIVKPNMTCLTCVSDDLKPLFTDYASEINSKMIFVDKFVDNIVLSDSTRFTYKNIEFEASLIANYQAYNAALAIEAAKFVEPSIELDLIKYGLMNTFWPGRMEIVMKKPYVILDGAHNIHGITGLVDSIKKMNYKDVRIVFSALADKAFDKMIEKLDEIAESFYFTSIDDKRKADASSFIKYTKKNYRVIENFLECIDTAIKEANEESLVLITGSLHFISCVRKIFKNN